MSHTSPITVEWTLNRRKAVSGRSERSTHTEEQPVPRLSRLMALALKFDGFVQQGIVRDYADLARLGHVSRARITQIMNLLNLAPDIQEEILRWGTDDAHLKDIPERKVRHLNSLVDWQEQRKLWRPDRFR